jgi:Raf kinase inhibitor-like YbhB/YbcL family protein
MESMARKKSVTIAAAATIVLAACLLFLFALRQRGREDIAGEQSRASFTVASSSFTSGQQMPSKLTCGDQELSPAVAFSVPPPRTKSFAIVMDDADAPFGFVHWIVYNIPSDVRAIAEGASSLKKLPTGSIEGMNSGGEAGYTGPCHKGHHYVVRVYALEIGTSLSPGMSKRDLASAVRGHVLAEGQLIAIDGENH